VLRRVDVPNSDITLRTIYSVVFKSSEHRHHAV
jgi:hypothetical protein